MRPKDSIWPYSGRKPRCLLALAGLVVFAGLPLSGQPDNEFLGLPPIDTGNMIEGKPTPGFSEFSNEERKSMQEMILVERFLSLPPERLTSVRRSIEQIEKMSPEEKERIKRQIQRFKRMGAQQRVQIHRKWNSLSMEYRSKMRNHWLSMSEEDRRVERSKLKSMTPEERRRFFRETFGEPRKKPVPQPYSLSVSEVILSEDNSEKETEEQKETANPAEEEENQEGEP